MKRRIAVAAMVLFTQHATAGSAHTIYKCETAQGITFSDRSCGSTSRPYEPDLSGVSIVDTVVPVPVPRSSPAPARPSRQTSALVISKAQACEHLQQSLHKIVSTMRAGYGAKQGERLRERKRELEEKRRAQKC